MNVGDEAFVAYPDAAIITRLGDAGCANRDDVGCEKSVLELG